MADQIAAQMGSRELRMSEIGMIRIFERRRKQMSHHFYDGLFPWLVLILLAAVGSTAQAGAIDPAKIVDREKMQPRGKYCELTVPWSR